ncbi:MAG: FAD-dependent oxidoreductase [Saccharofermentans sp.]|nr:FAD-dependent oxidoreductase [Saccharofermentans sp.]
MSKFLILGAGPSGLSFANKLLKNGVDDFLVLERFGEAGGLCRSVDVDGTAFDFGGGHFLDVRRKNVLDFLFAFMPESEWNTFDRDSQICIHGKFINSPIEANIWQMDLNQQVEYLKAIAVAGCNLGEEMPEHFVDWIYWKLGSKVAEDYMLPYNRKMFGKDLNELGTYWLSKLPNVSFEETLISCLEKKAYGSQPAHAKFYYPKKFGYGEIWKRMADNLGDRIIYNEKVNKIDLNTRTVNDKYSADIIVNTIPYAEFTDIEGMDSEVRALIDTLKFSSVVTEYHPENMDTHAQWIYYPDENLSYHRILVRHNFCSGSKGYWTETNLTRFKEDKNYPSFVNDYAYPLNTIGKNENMKTILDHLESKGVYGLGRWGEWQHYNSDVVVELAMNLADKLTN